MTELYDNSEFGETQRTVQYDNDFPLHEEDVAVEEDPNDLDTIYNQLTLFEKLRDNRWQVRRRAYCELFDFFESGQAPSNLGGDELTPENMIPWIQNLISEQNLIALADALKALNAFLTHHTCSRPQLASFVGPLIDKLILTKKNIQKYILEILDKLIEGDDATNILGEILKKLDTKNFKFLNQVLTILLKYVKRKNGPDENTVRTVFKSMLPLLIHSNKDIRHSALEIFKVLYSYIEESFKELKTFAFGNLRQVQLKELEVLQKTPKIKSRKLVKLNDGSFKVGDGALKKTQIAQKVDLMSLLPEKYLEVPYLVQGSGESNQNEKKRKLEEFNHRLEQAIKTGCEIDVNKDTSVLINLLVLMLEDKNILINAEAVKSVDYLARIMREKFPASKLKHILTLVIEKLDAKKKTAYNASLTQFLDDSVIYSCLTFESLCDIFLYNAESNKNINVRTSCLNWFDSSFVSFLTDRREVLYANMTRGNEGQRQDKISASTAPKTTKATAASVTNLDPEERIERLTTTVFRKLQQIHKKESNITFKKRCQQVLENLENINQAQDKPSARGRGEHDHCIGDLSSIRHNSKAVNISNISLPHADTVYDEIKESLNEDINENQFLSLEGAERPAIDDEKLKNEFCLDNLKPAEREQFEKIMMMFKEIKPQDELVADKLEAISGAIDRTNMEVVQAGQRTIAKTLKDTLLVNSADARLIYKVFDCSNNLLVKMNKICLEVYTDTLKIELKIILLFLANILGGKSIEKCLDSMYMTCSLDKFLAITLVLFDKLDSKYSKFIPVDKLTNAVRVYINWLVVKVEKLQSVMLEEGAIKDLERAFSEFRFANLPQIHLGLVNVLTKKVRNIEDYSIACSSIRDSVRDNETPGLSERRIDILERPIGEELNIRDLGDAEHRQMTRRMKNIQEQTKTDLRTSLDEFGKLLNFVKEKNMERLSVPSNLDSSVSPSRHWKRGLGRNGTPGRGERDSASPNVQDSFLRSRNIQGREELDQDGTSSLVEIGEVSKYLSEVCDNLTERELALFELTLFKIRATYSTKDSQQLICPIISKLLARNSFNVKYPGSKVIRLLQNYFDNLDRAPLMQTLKAIFCVKTRENELESAHNAAQVGLELVLNYYKETRFPNKLISSIVEMVVYSLTKTDLKPRAEEVLELISKTTGHESLRRIFEIELINSSKLYQVFLDWLDEQNPPTPTLAQLKRKTPSPEKKDEIYVEDNHSEGPSPQEYSLSPSISPPQNQEDAPKRQSLTSDVKHSFDQALEDAGQHDMDQISNILITEPDIDNPQRQAETSLPVGKNDISLTIPTLAQFRQTLRCNYGQDNIKENHNEDSNKKIESEEKRPTRTILGERNFDERQNLPSRELVVGYQATADHDDKENLRVNPRHEKTHQESDSMLYKQARDDSAEKWKEKYIHEKQRLQQTLEVLDKTNSLFYGQVTEKTDLITKLNDQRHISENLMNKFNAMSQENERLKKETQNLELEKDKLAQHSMMIASAQVSTSKYDQRRMLSQKFVSETLAIAAKGQGRSQDEFIKQFQELLLTADNLEFEVGEALIRLYEELEDFEEKVRFVVNLKISISHPQVLANLSVQNHKFLLEISLKLCISENTQKEIVLGSDGVTFIETDLTNEMQLLLDTLLRFHSINATLSNLLKILSDQMPLDFNAELLKGKLTDDWQKLMLKGPKMMLKLITKCLVKLSSNFKSFISEDIKAFDLLIEIYKLFKLHPPENLKETQPNIKDFELIYRHIRTLADHVIDFNPQKAKEFADFFTRENNKSIFLGYVKSYTAKYHPNIHNLSASNISF